jgi:hypothetical protein
MKITEQIAKHLKDVHFGGNWTAVNLKDKVADVSWQQATASVHSLHSIATLVFHLNYYVSATIRVLRGEPLQAKDKLSFDCPPIPSEEDWQRLLNKTWADAKELASLIERMPDRQLSEIFIDKNYGTYFRCLEGLVEHCHYHLGQISMIRTIVRQDD